MTTPPGVPSERYQRLAQLSSTQLRAIYLASSAPDPLALAGHRYRGWNRPWWLAIARIRKFAKAFARESVGQSVYGWNEPVEQGPLSRPWQLRTRNGAVKRYGFYSVNDVVPTSRDNANLRALLLDYSADLGRGREISHLLRDYVVAIDEDSIDLIVGRAYVAVFRWRIPVAYFILERWGGSDDYP